MNHDDKVTKEECDVIIEDRVVVGSFNKITNQSKILNDAIIGNSSFISNSVIESSAEVNASVLEKCKVHSFASVGVYSHLRPNSVIKEHAKIGNFVETKNAIVGKNTKASHLTYIGDAEIGTDCNIACGTIFCNYNGKIKQKSVLGNHVFVGSNVNIVAPVSIGNNAFIAAGSTITKDVPNNAFAIARAYQTNKDNYIKGWIKWLLLWV